ncbi:uncharacterized protein LOC144107726 isoform X2 [Amblyomma americanum]
MCCVYLSGHSVISSRCLEIPRTLQDLRTDPPTLPSRCRRSCREARRPKSAWSMDVKRDEPSIIHTALPVPVPTPTPPLSSPVRTVSDDSIEPAAKKKPPVSWNVDGI